MPTPTETFNRLTRDDRWLGFGYLGGRANVLDSSDPEAPAQPELVEATDQLVLEHATAQGWTEEQLFAWANSKTGRWFAATMFGGSGPIADRLSRARRHGLLNLPREAGV